MNKKLVSLLMAGTLSLSAVPFHALANGEQVEEPKLVTGVYEGIETPATIIGEELTKYQTNMKAVTDVVYSKSTNTITVTADTNSMVSYAGGGGEQKYYALVMDFSNNANITASAGYNIQPVDKEHANKFADATNPLNSPIVFWLNGAKTKTTFTLTDDTNKTQQLTVLVKDVNAKLKPSSVKLEVSSKTNWWGKDITADDFVVGGTSGLTFDIGTPNENGEATIKVTGTLKHVTDFPQYGGEQYAQGYYLPLTATINDLANGATGMIGSRGINGDKLNYAKTYRNFLFYLPETPGKELKIIVDADQIAADNEGIEFARTVYDLDLTDLKLGETELVTNDTADVTVTDVTATSNVKTIYGTAIGNGIATPATVSEVKALFQNTNTNLEVRKPDGTALTDSDPVYSGCKIVLKNTDGTDADSVTVIIKGAFGSTGQCGLSDLVKVASAFKNTLTLSELEALIGDANDSGNIDLADLVKIATAYKA